jgi:hypothetical protein
MKEEILSMSADYTHERYLASELRAFERQIAQDVNSGNRSAFDSLVSVITFNREHYGHYLHEAGERLPYRILDMLGESVDAKFRKQLYLKVLLSIEPLLPLDFQGLVGHLLLSAIQKNEISLNKGELEELIAFAQTQPSFRARSSAAMARIKTDGIDHLFPIPMTPEERVKIVDAAAQLKARERSALIISRFCAKLGVALSYAEQPVHGMRSSQVEVAIKQDVGDSLLCATDFLVPWTQVLTSDVDGALTLAEICRITLLAPEFKLPDEKVRLALIGYYRSALRICGRATIGLGSGVFHVEHGTLCEPSYFYMGRGSIIGKGCMIDGVGGAVLLRESFIGGGFMPILVHTHKHIRVQGQSAALERKRLLPCVFLMKEGVRFPMSRIGLFEAADHIGTSSGMDGVDSLPIDSAAIKFQKNGEIHL